MDINATLIGQFITFALLIGFTMKYVWPPIMKAMHDRETKIAAGLEAAERGQRELEAAEHQALTIIREARQQANHLIEQANLHSAKLVEEAKTNAITEGQRLITLAQSEIDREVTDAKSKLKSHLTTLAIAGAEKIIKKNLDSSAHQDLLTELAAEI
jgi:F-type H+-transporting ATPase subunit b